MTSTSKSDLPAGTGAGREPNVVETGEAPGVQRSASSADAEGTSPGGTSPKSETSAPTTESASTESADSSSEAEGGPASRAPKASARKSSTKRARARAGTQPNNVRKLRQEAMMSKAELARRAGVSPLTIDRVEAGCPCRMDTKRKILEALGLDPSARAKVWPDIDN